jgi:uncharacterized membrane protein
MLLQACRWLQNNYFIELLNGTAWTAAALEIVHYFSMFILVGAMLILDLRILGLLGRNQNAARLAERLFPWIWISVALNFISGFFMFAGSAVAYYRNDVFYDKMGVVVLAIVVNLLVQRRMGKWDQSPAIPVSARLAAAISIILWVAAIVAGVEVPALTGVG